uniref:Uncharacterized protein n=1 Tax=Anguilla anguilla TaxID=7936 RepID=A0A0E9UB73_ANGAN
MHIQYNVLIHSIPSKAMDYVRTMKHHS